MWFYSRCGNIPGTGTHIPSAALIPTLKASSQLLSPPWHLLSSTHPQHKAMLFPLHSLENKVKGEKYPLPVSSAPRNQRLRHQGLASWHYQLSQGIMHRLHTQSLSAVYLTDWVPRCTPTSGIASSMMCQCPKARSTPIPSCLCKYFGPGV